MRCALGLINNAALAGIFRIAARTVGWLLGVSGILAVVMTAIGLFGVIAYMVQRRHEIGIRMALGARRSDVVKMVMSQGLQLTAIGLGIGLAAAFGASRLLSPLLYGIGANDPTTMTAVATGLVAIALAACYLPARKSDERRSFSGSATRMSRPRRFN